jgi:hypothetical protein
MVRFCQEKIANEKHSYLSFAETQRKGCEIPLWKMLTVFILTVAAQPVEDGLMCAYCKPLAAKFTVEVVLNRDLHIIDPRAAVTDEVVVLMGPKIIAIRTLGGRDLCDQPLLGQELQVAIDRGQADMGQAPFHPSIDLLCCGMGAVPLKCGEDSLALLSDPW